MKLIWVVVSLFPLFAPTFCHYRKPQGNCDCKCDPSGPTYWWKNNGPQGDCKTTYHGRKWCYVDDSASHGCQDLVESEQKPGKKWSYQACKSVHMQCTPQSTTQVSTSTSERSLRTPRGVSRNCEYKNKKHQNPQQKMYSWNSNLRDCKRSCEQKGNCLLWSLEEPSKRCYHYMETFTDEQGTTTGYPYCGLCP